MGPLDQARALFSLVFNRPQPMPNLLPREGMKFAPSMGKNYQVQRPPVKPNPVKKTGAGFDQPMLQPKGPAPSMQPQATPLPTGDLATRIKAGFVGQVGHVPALDYIPEFVEAAQQYPIFQQNPFLMPQVAILETSGGKHITRPNNLINYGIRDPKINELFSQVGIRDALRRSLKEIGSTGNTYARFRTGKKLTNEELQDFARTYEPMNDSYYDNLIKGIQFFENQ